MKLFTNARDDDSMVCWPRSASVCGTGVPCPDDSGAEDCADGGKGGGGVGDGPDIEGGVALGTEPPVIW